jgi:hypothetical protein
VRRERKQNCLQLAHETLFVFSYFRFSDSYFSLGFPCLAELKKNHTQDHVVKGRRVERHIHELGLTSEDEYRSWCLDHGFSKDLHKSNAQRQKEQDLATQLRGEAALSKKRRVTRHPQNTITSLHKGEHLNEDLGAEYLENIRAQFSNLNDDAKTQTQTERNTPILTILEQIEYLKSFES